MCKIKNIFLCTTEYHLFMSFHLIYSLYKSSIYDNLIIMTIGMRINVCKYDKSHLSNAKMIEVDWYELRSQNFLSNLLRERCSNFYYFLSHFPVHRYLVRKFSKKGAKIILVQDGLKPYVKIENFNFYKFLSVTYNNILEFLNIHDYAGMFMLFSYSNYVNDKRINEVWLTHPKSFSQNINKNQSIIEIPEFSQNSINHLALFYNYNLQIDFTVNSILYITQPIELYENRVIEIQFLKEFSSKHPQFKLFIKFHPSRDMVKKLFITELPDAVFLEGINFPAELIIQKMKKIIIMSLYSTALLINNPKCRFYFIYPILKSCNSCKSIVPNPIDHIKIISTVEEIEFYEN